MAKEDYVYYIDEFEPNKKDKSICDLELSRSRPSESLLETDNVNNPRPTSGPEIDDLDPPEKAGPSDRGIDDGLLDSDGKDRSHGIPSLPPTYPDLNSIPDVNVYQQKKIIAQGMMDLALISANASQFRYVLQTQGRHPYYYASLSMIGISLIVQLIVGVGLIWNCRFNVNVNSQMCKANLANNWVVVGVFLVTVLNVFISSFSVVELSEAVYACADAVK